MDDCEPGTQLGVGAGVRAKVAQLDAEHAHEGAP
jgi:hypothetical protein